MTGSLRCLIAIGLLLLHSSTAQALNLLQAYEAALSNDPEFRMALKENEAGQASRVVGRAAVLPQVTASVYQASTDSKISGPAFLNGPNVITNRAYPSNNTVVQLTQPIFNLEALARYRLGHAQADLSDARFMYRSQDLLVRVLQAYTDVLYAQDQLTFISVERDAKKEQLNVNKRMLEKGEGTITDKLETQASYEMSEAQVIEAQDNLELAKRKLEALIGEPLPNVSVVRKLSNQFRVIPLVPSAFELWRETALASNPELRAQSHNIEVSRQDYQRNRAAHFPVLSGVAMWNQAKSYTVSTIYQDTNTSSVGVQLSIPIFTGGEVTGRTSQARANFEKSQAEFDTVTNKVITELRKQYDLVISSQKKVEALTRAVESASELVKAMRKSIQAGQRINLDALIADKGLANAQRDLSQARYAYLLATLRLKQQAGVLTVEDLEKVATNFQQPASQINDTRPIRKN
jgi:protease secretion system outer membrane protein